MKIIGIHLRGHESLPNVSLSFKRDDGSVYYSVGLEGASGSGKSLLLKLMAESWSGSVRKKSSSWSLRAEMCRVDFEVDGEVLSVHVRGDRVEGSPKLAALFGQGRILLKYDSSRLTRMPGWTSMVEPGGVTAIWPIISDLHQQDFRDSIVLVDDFDMGLDAESSLEFFKYLKRHLLSKGNQLIIAGRGTESLGCDHRVILAGGLSPLDRSLALFQS